MDQQAFATLPERQRGLHARSATERQGETESMGMRVRESGSERDPGRMEAA